MEKCQKCMSSYLPQPSKQWKIKYKKKTLNLRTNSSWKSKWKSGKIETERKENSFGCKISQGVRVLHCSDLRGTAKQIPNVWMGKENG